MSSCAKCRNIERKAKKSVDESEHKVVCRLVNELLDDVRQRFPSTKMEELPSGGREEHPEQPSQVPAEGGILRDDTPGLAAPGRKTASSNISQCGGGQTGAKGHPVILETNPPLQEPFRDGRARHRPPMARGTRTSCTSSWLHRQGQRRLSRVECLDTLSEPGVWTMLKRYSATSSGDQPIESGLFGASSALKPERWTGRQGPDGGGRVPVPHALQSR